MGETSFDWRRFLRPPSLPAWLDACWANRPWIIEAFRLQHRDRPGLAVHLFLGLLACFTLSFPYAVHEWVLPIAAAASLIRITMTWRLLFHMLILPATLVGLAWLAFRALSLAWTPDPSFGLVHLSEARYMLLILALWPIMEHRTLLIGAYLAGMFVGNLVQLAEGIGLLTHTPWLIWERHNPGRITGWWRPAFGGASLTVPLAIWLYAAFWARTTSRRMRTLAIVMSLVSLAAVIASGTRSAWITSACLIAIVALVRARTAMRRRTLAIWIAGGVVLSAMMAPIALPRVRAAVDDLTRVIKQRDFDSDTGARILMWIESARAFASHPLAGVGEGGFRTWAQRDAATWTDSGVERIAEHAHGTIPHVAAVNGLIGLAFFALLSACVLRAAWVQPRDGPCGLERSLMLAMIALLIVGQFETLHVGSRLKQHFWLVVALSPAVLPPPRRARANDERSWAPDRGA